MNHFLLVAAILFAPPATAGKELTEGEKAELLAKLDAPYYHPARHGLKSLEVKMKSVQIDELLLQSYPNRYARPRGRHLWRAPGARRLWVSGVPRDLAERQQEAEQFFQHRVRFIVPATYGQSLKKLIIYRAPDNGAQVLRCFEDRFAAEPLKTLYIDEQGKVTRMEVRAQGSHTDIRYTYYGRELCPQGLLLRRARYTVKTGKQTKYFEHQFYYAKTAGYYLLKRMTTMRLEADGSAVTSIPNPLALELYDHRVNLPEEEPGGEAPTSAGAAETESGKSQ
jgi:hypothetical protein